MLSMNEVIPRKSIPPRERERRRGNESSSVRSPTMAGGLFSIDREFFYHIGAYDEQMKFWGGDNVEMSLRVKSK